MKIFNFKIILISFSIISCMVSTASGLIDSDAAEKGLEIAKEADRRFTGFGDCEEVCTMILQDRRGNKRLRNLRMRILERENEGDFSLTIFDKPADVKGTAMLTHSHGIDPDDQWLYLPALKRVKRISSQKKSGPFMGSEFSFEDLSPFEIEKYTYLYLRDESLNDIPCFVSEWKPAYKYSGYERMVIWHDTAEYRVQRIDFYDRKNRLLKTLNNKDYRLFSNKFWRPMRFEMVNHQTGKSTLLEYSDYRFGLGLNSRDFDKNALKNFR